MITYPSLSFDSIDGESAPRNNMTGIVRMRYIRTAQQNATVIHMFLETSIR
jgi:hypothetical protein